MSGTYSIEFCVHLAKAVAESRKTRTIKPCAVGLWVEPGDVLTVQEPWCKVRNNVHYLADTCGIGFGAIVYYPVNAQIMGGYYGFIPRLTLVVINAWQCRLHDLSESDASQCVPDMSPLRTSYLEEFKAQWSSSYFGSKSWDKNPSCWNIEFKLAT